MKKTMIMQKAEELNYSMDNLNREIKRVASQKCRLNKMPGRADYAAKMAEYLEEEELLKGVRDYLKGPAKNVNTLTEEQIAEMDYITVCKAIRSIQSKKTHTKYADDCLKDETGLFIPGSGESYKEACRIEDLLKARREQVKPETDKFSRAIMLEFLDEMQFNAGGGEMSEEFNAIYAFVKGGE